ncbi:multidrug effflux MFS transporter [Bdellovibrio sp. NC01]|uniref:multidrug effflux MFS transporter n=1 Tax=Bdellovibrio sp. NC01 TaxID=2220073 RepID=UPI00143D54CC|nr:multidrug effflux MFS transporter [Bdellovibrio sp. NC01]
MDKENSKLLNGIGLVLLLGTLTALDPLTIDMYLPAFGSIQKDFMTTMSNVELSVSTFFVGMAFGQLFYGPLADRFGRKLPLQLGMLVYFFATLGCAFAPNIETFIGFRLLQALGGCAGMVITRAIIRDLFDTKQVATFLSNMALVMGIAPIIAPTVGAVINEHFGWKAIFFVLAGANLLCMIAIAIFLPETSKVRKTELKIGTVFTSYIKLLGNRNFVGYLIPDTAVRAGMFAYIAGSPFVFIELLGIPSEKYGLIFGLNGLGLVLASQVNRRLLSRWAPDTILRWSVRIAAIASACVLLFAWSGPSKYVFLGSIFIFLASLNFISPNSLAGALSSQGHQAGTASALYGCLQWSMASVSSYFVSYFHNGTAFPMSGVILFCGLLSLCAFQFLVVQPAKRTPASI